MDNEWHGNDPPWADPRIEADYVVALGSFLVAFNRIEAMVSDLIVRSMQFLSLDNKEIERTLGRSLKRRVEDLVKLLREAGKPEIPADEIARLSTKRNTLAHGHFEQNPFSGEYEIVGRDRQPDPVKWSPEEIGKLQAEADKLWHELRQTEVTFWFEDLDAADQS